MQINLPARNFSFFKVVTGVLVLSFFCLHSYYLSILTAFFINSHVFGAWFSVWKSNRASVQYYIWIILLFIATFFISFNFLSLIVLVFITHLLFLFHFMYDEFDLQEEKRSINNIISSLNPTILIFLFLIKDFYNLNISINIFLLVSLILLVLELILLKEINWFFVQTKILIILLFYSFYLNFNVNLFFSNVLVFHYLFWFVYPVYKLHKNGQKIFHFIFQLLVIVFIFGVLYIYFWRVGDLLFIKYFQVISIMHIITMPPFGYFFGLRKKGQSAILEHNVGKIKNK